MPSQKRKISIIGSTGSIGTQALEVLEYIQDQFEITAIANRELNRSIFYTASIAKAHELGYPVLNCLLCKYRKRNDDGKPYCEKTGIMVEVESEAINCSTYIYDEKRRNRFLKSFIHFKYLDLDLWERNHNHKTIKFKK